MRILLTLAAFVSGLLAGANFDRGAVGTAAWTSLGPQAWAAYSRHADLGNGLILYPALAVGSAMLIAASVVAFHREFRSLRANRVAATFLYAALACSFLGLALTIKAAPIMLSLADANTSVESAFASFSFWSNMRAVFQIASFAFSLASLFSLTSRYR
jgi:hypothetical protein